MEDVIAAVTTPVAQTGVSFIWAISFGQIVTIIISSLTLLALFIGAYRDLRWIKREMTKQNAVLQTQAIAITRLDGDLNFLARIVMMSDAELVRRVQQEYKGPLKNGDVTGSDA